MQIDRGKELTSEDYRSLEASWITPALARQAGLRRVDPLEGAEIVGQRGRDCSGIIFPYVDPEDGNVVAYRIRRDHPDFEEKDGTSVVCRKYLSAPGQRNHIYFVPGTRYEELQDPSLAIYITEGEKKTLALYRMREEGEYGRFLPIGLAGVWSWRGTCGIRGNAKGERVPVKGAIPDLRRIDWRDRRVFIIFDANVETNEQVRLARSHLSQELCQQGASVRFVSVPDLQGVNGIDDLLALRGPSEAEQIFDEAVFADAEAEAKRIVATADVDAIVDAAPIFAGLSEAALAKIRPQLPKGLPPRQFDRLLKQARANRQAKTPEPDGALPTIVVTDMRMRDISDLAMRAVQHPEKEPEIFVRSGALVRVSRDEAERPLIERLNEDSLRGVLDRSANFYEKLKSGDFRPIPPPLECVKDIKSLGTWPFLALESIIETPVMRPDGSILVAEGYDRATKLFYAPAEGLVIPAIPDEPTQADAAAALEVLKEAFLDFCFGTEADRANALGLCLTLPLRPAINGKVPMALVTAPQQANGKTLLAETLGIISTGGNKAVSLAPRAEEEWDKRILSILLGGRSFVILDNVDHRLESPALAAVLTSSEWEGRILGASEQVRVPHRAVWVATGNNIRLGGDIARRCFPIRLDAQSSRPGNRSGFKHDPLAEWVTANRGQLLAAGLTLARAWHVAGRPTSKGPVVASFEAWTRTVGSILAFAGVEGFLSNLSGLEEIDDEVPQYENFLRNVYEAFGGARFTVSDLVRRMASGSVLENSLPDGFAAEISKSGASRQQKIGQAFSSRIDRRYGEDELHLVRAGVRSGVAHWQVRAQVKPVVVVNTERILAQAA